MEFKSGGRAKLPVVIRALIGRGWGQGPQHSKPLYSILSGIPGLKMVMPTTLMQKDYLYHQF